MDPVEQRNIGDAVNKTQKVVIVRAVVTMMLRGVQRMWLRMALLTAMASTFVHVHADGPILRQNTGRELHEDRTVTAGKLEDLWEKEAALAEREDERLLQIGGGMSFTSRPSRSPLTGRPNGTPQPTRAPTRAPNLGTPVPTPAMTTFGPTMAVTTMQPTLNNACLLGRTPTQYLLDELSLISDPVLLLNPSTPQGRAFVFITEDPAVIDVGVCNYPTINQRYGLTTFYFSTNGDAWTENTGWLGTLGECSWFGVTCVDGTNVADLLLPNNNVNGDIPNEISTLFAAERLGFFGNGLTSTIPTGISNLTSIIVLDFENNFMDGMAIPESIRGLATLEGLFFSRNVFTGSIPEDINRLSALTQFWVANNDLEGTLPSTLGAIPNLQTIIANTNRMRGAIPSQLGALNLTNLQLYENRLDGPIPGEIYEATNLNVLRLDFNFLDGTIDPAVGDLLLLEDLRLNNNILNGNIPSTISQLTNLQFLTAGSNFLDGPIPDVFALYQQLDTADFSRSSFSGPIPSSIFIVPTLRLLYLNNNALTGPIPASYANPPLLRDLFLNNNLLTGTVPEIATGQLSALNELPLQVNRLTGSVPQSVCLLRTNGELDDLFVDCGGATPEIECDFPACCNRCFESPGRRRLEQRYNFDLHLRYNDDNDYD